MVSLPLQGLAGVVSSIEPLSRLKAERPGLPCGIDDINQNVFLKAFVPLSVT